MTLPVFQTRAARKDLAAIYRYLDEHSPAAADRLADLIEKRCDLLCQFPRIGRERPELAPGLRSVAIERYVLFYRVTSAAVEVVRILHGARDINSIMKHKPKSLSE